MVPGGAELAVGVAVAGRAGERAAGAPAAAPATPAAAGRAAGGLDRLGRRLRGVQRLPGAVPSVAGDDEGHVEGAGHVVRVVELRADLLPRTPGGRPAPAAVQGGARALEVDGVRQTGASSRGDGPADRPAAVVVERGHGRHGRRGGTTGGRLGRRRGAGAGRTRSEHRRGHLRTRPGVAAFPVVTALAARQRQQTGDREGRRTGRGTSPRTTASRAGQQGALRVVHGGTPWARAAPARRAVADPASSSLHTIITTGSPEPAPALLAPTARIRSLAQWNRTFERLRVGLG